MKTRNTAGRIFTLFILLLFLSPLIGSELHSLSHLNDVHCTATGVHFHQEEHHCNLCDFLLPVSISPGVISKDFTDIISVSTFLLFRNSEAILSCTGYFFSLRAPPSFI